MGCSYSMDGKMLVRKSEAVEKLLEDLESEFSDDIEVEIKERGSNLEIAISGCQECSYTTAMAIDKKIVAFSDHVVDAAQFDMDCDGDTGILWVGTPEMVEHAKKQKKLQACRVALDALTNSEAVSVISEWAKSRNITELSIVYPKEPEASES